MTTNYIIAELVALLTNPLRIPRPRQIDFIRGIQTAPHVQIIHVDGTLDTQAWHLLEQRPDKAWSLVDCTSFIIMQQHGITEALTTDHHFLPKLVLYHCYAEMNASVQIDTCQSLTVPLVRAAQQALKVTCRIRVSVQILVVLHRRRNLQSPSAGRTANAFTAGIVHIDIRDGKVWIQHDGTEEGIANRLVAYGVPKSAIVLGFHSPYKRQCTEFALG